jgi:hypothetical protein
VEPYLGSLLAGYTVLLWGEAGAPFSVGAADDSACLVDFGFRG